MQKTPIIRDSAIQRFEYTFELTIKFIKRYIEAEYSTLSDYNPSVFNDIIRTALQLNVTKKSVLEWPNFRNARNKTSHGYDETIADEVYEIAKSFLDEAKSVYDFLKSKLLFQRLILKWNG